MLLSGLRQTIARQSHLALVGESFTGAGALQLAEELAPDMILTEVHLPDMNGIEVTRRVLATRPALKIVIFSGDADRRLVDQALQAGACGYVLKRSAAEELLQAIDWVMAGRVYLSPDVSVGIIEAYRKSLRGDSDLVKPSLPEREKEMLRLIAEGRRNKEIAAQLNLSLKSVEAYRSRLMKKLSCASSAELVRYAIREGIVAP